ncbi:uncharacterized protein LOC128219789 [Mya arenaria]|uniref:uncharacterized protein LOC128219789 n=1 Tax=Mya arenaria TaxID=6604 RepID=UPI0022E625E1|nr:uncharacterized protein LOC128219789 [Mya arenaria]
MVFSWIFTSLVCVLTVGWARSACDQSTLNSEATQNCVKGFYNYISQVMSSVSDPREIATIFCSAEGQSVIECMFPLMEQCPELMANMGDGAMAMPSQADLLKACSQIPSGLCLTAMTCVSNASHAARMGIDENFRPANNLTFLLPYMGLYCGPVKEQFDCLTPEVEEQCQNHTDQIKQMIPMLNADMQYDTLKLHIRNGCKDVPKDIGTNKCVKDHFESAAFMECMSKVKTDYKTEVEMKSCGASDARLMCLKESVEKPCGKRYYTALATNADYFLSSNLFTCDRSMSTAPVVRLSAAASLVAVLAALLL